MSDPKPISAFANQLANIRLPAMAPVAPEPEEPSQWEECTERAAGLLTRAGILQERCKGQDFAIMVEMLARALAFDLPHGFYIVGGAGNGKTTLLNLIATHANCRRAGRYELKHAKDCYYEFKRADGDQVTDAAWSARGFLLDDMGDEPTGNHYGTKTEWLKEVIEMRWRKYERNSAPTFITSNLSLGHIEMRYGERISSRISGMCRIVQLETPDQRRPRQ
jgi:DNA replication protein DnaC